VQGTRSQARDPLLRRGQGTRSSAGDAAPRAHCLGGGPLSRSRLWAAKPSTTSPTVVLCESALRFADGSAGILPWQMFGMPATESPLMYPCCWDAAGPARAPRTSVGVYETLTARWLPATTSRRERHRVVVLVQLSPARRDQGADELHTPWPPPAGPAGQLIFGGSACTSRLAPRPTRNACALLFGTDDPLADEICSRGGLASGPGSRCTVHGRSPASSRSRRRHPGAVTRGSGGAPGGDWRRFRRRRSAGFQDSCSTSALSCCPRGGRGRADYRRPHHQSEAIGRLADVWVPAPCPEFRIRRALPRHRDKPRGSSARARRRIMRKRRRPS